MSLGVKNIMKSMPRMYWTTLWLVMTMSIGPFALPTPQTAAVAPATINRPSVFFMAILIARCVFKAYDLPVRAWLTEHWLKRKK